MRIGIVCPYSFDIPGGVQYHVRDLAEVFGDIDKGAGIDLPLDQLPAPAGAGPRTPAGVTVAEVSEAVDAVPGSLGAVEAVRELLRRWRSLRAPRPSGT